MTKFSIFKLVLTPWKVEPLLLGMKFQEKKEENDEKDIRELFIKSPKESFLLTLDLKRFKS